MLILTFPAKNVNEQLRFHALFLGISEIILSFFKCFAVIINETHHFLKKYFVLPTHSLVSAFSLK